MVMSLSLIGYRTWRKCVGNFQSFHLYLLTKQGKFLKSIFSFFYVLTFLFTLYYLVFIRYRVCLWCGFCVLCYTCVFLAWGYRSLSFRFIIGIRMH